MEEGLLPLLKWQHSKTWGVLHWSNTNCALPNSRWLRIAVVICKNAGMFTVGFACFPMFRIAVCFACLPCSCCRWESWGAAWGFYFGVGRKCEEHYSLSFRFVVFLPKEDGLALNFWVSLCKAWRGILTKAKKGRGDRKALTWWLVVSILMYLPLGVGESGCCHLIA